MALESCGTSFDAHGLFLIYGSPFFYAAIFAGLLLLVILNRKKLRASFSRVNKKYYVVLIAVFLLALWLRAPRLYTPHETLASAWEYVQGAKFLASDGTLQRCEYGSFNDCLCPSLVSHPAGISFLLSAVFFLFGANMSYLAFLQFLGGGLAAVAIFFLSYSLTKDEKASILSSFFIAALPLHITYSVTTEGFLSTLSALFTILYFIFFLHALKEKTRRSYALAAFACAALLALKMEYLMYIPVSVLLYFHVRGFKRETLHKLRAGISSNRVTLLVASALATAPVSVFVRFWVIGGYAYSSFRLSYLPSSLYRFVINAESLLMPWLLLFVFCVPLLLVSKASRRLSAALYAWFLVPIAFFAFFVYGPSGRYLVPISIPFALVLGLGTSHVAMQLGKARHVVMVAIPATLLLFSQSIPPWASGAVKMSDVLTLMEAAPDSSVFVVPCMNTVWAIQSFDSNVTTVPFLYMPNLHADSFYFLYTDRCAGKQYSEICSYLANVGEMVSRSGGARLYLIRPSSEQREGLTELHEKYKAFF